MIPCAFVSFPRSSTEKCYLHWYISTVVFLLLLNFSLYVLWFCIFHLDLSRLLDDRWLIAYQTALSFRCSNYFVGFISESSCLLCGIGTVVKDDKDETIEW